MAEFLWTFAVQEMVKVAAGEICVAWGLEEELSNLSKWLLDSGAILRDVNREKLHNESVRRWVDGLRDVVCEAEDLLDELVYEDLRRTVETMVRNLTFPSINPLLRLDMAKKMKEITELLKQHHRSSAPLGLVGKESTEKDNESNLKQIRETTSILSFDVVGRETEVLDVLKLVVDSSNENPLSIIPVVGMGGLGKTTLAKLVFCHELIKKHFHETIWVCVSECFNIDEILRAILETLTIQHVPSKRETLLRRLQKELQDKRYFLVLDDVWNENYELWDEMENCLKMIAGKSGNIVMVTTRIDEVAEIMGTISSYHLEKLPEDQCWSLFKKSANANGVEIDPKLAIIQKELLKKIDGIPLVAKVLGGAVEFQGDSNRWVTTLESVVRKIPVKEKGFVLSILQLSVDRLPFLEKQCFAFCSNFPKDYKFVKESLIQMWMAQGFIHPKEEESIMMEDIGEEYFNFLLSRSLFQDVIKDKFGRITHFKIHDLIHDVAFAISNHQKLELDLSNWSGKAARKLRILICNNQEIRDKLADCIGLRVLEVNYLQINNLPTLIGKLKHMRYLDISIYPMNEPPKSIDRLYNLQTLKVGSIEILPKNLRKLVNLRHLEFHFHCSTKQMPSHMSELVHLQTLSEFVVGFEKGRRIEELGHLKNLKGQLQLSNLERVKGKEEAIAAKLVEKKNLCELSFEWSLEFLRECSNYNDFEVLEGLQPHKNLRYLKITNFGGQVFPNAIFVENLVFLYLYGCTKCETLPMLGQLPNLKELDVWFMDSLRSIGSEFYGNHDSSQRDYFPKLMKLDFSWMCNLQQWEEVAVADVSNRFGSLQTLKFDRCGKLTKLPNGLESCSSIHDLIIYKCPNLALNVQNMHHLSLLSIDGLKKLPEGLSHLLNLRTMMTTGCMQEYDFSSFIHLPFLTKLYLNDGSRNVTQLPQQLEHLTALKILAIENFNGIEALPECLGNLTSLETLDLVHCKNLKQLPSKEAMLCLTKLNHLKVMGCPMLLLDQSHTERANLSHLPTDCVHMLYVEEIEPNREEIEEQVLQVVQSREDSDKTLRHFVRKGSIATLPRYLATRHCHDFSARKNDMSSRFQA